jgi:hypothetical protein
MAAPPIFFRSKKLKRFMKLRVGNSCDVENMETCPVETCPVCLVPYEDNIYVIGCGSKDSAGNELKHTVCNGCEHELRIRTPLKWLNGQFSRIIECVLCRQPELDLTKRTIDSLMKELAVANATISIHDQIVQNVYVPRPQDIPIPRVLVPRAPRVPRVPRVGSAVKQWCVKRGNGCATKSKTTRNCSTDGCIVFVCRACRTC